MPFVFGSGVHISVAIETLLTMISLALAGTEHMYSSTLRSNAGKRILPHAMSRNERTGEATQYSTPGPSKDSVRRPRRFPARAVFTRQSTHHRDDDGHRLPHHAAEHYSHLVLEQRTQLGIPVAHLPVVQGARTESGQR